jgi:hypothetical protein
MRRRKKAVEAPLEEARSFLKRLIEEEDVCDAFGRALESSRDVYERVAGAKKPARLLSDEGLHTAATDAYEALRHLTGGLASHGQEVKEIVTGSRKRQRRRLGAGRIVPVAILGAVGALVASEGLRSKLLDKLFGAEEEFQYSPPPAEPSDTPSPLNAA